MKCGLAWGITDELGFYLRSAFSSLCFNSVMNVHQRFDFCLILASISPSLTFSDIS